MSVPFAKSLVDGQFIEGDGNEVTSVNAGTTDVSCRARQINRETFLRALRAANTAFEETFFDPRGVEKCINFLRFAAEEMDVDLETALQTFRDESALGTPRDTIEHNRTTGQANKHAGWLESRAWMTLALAVRAEANQDLRTMDKGIGAIFGYGPNNFPKAFREGGGDWASATAAQCPTLFRAHRLQMATSFQQVEKINRARERAGLHPGFFQWVVTPRSYGPDESDNVAHLAAASDYIAGGFGTGSQSGGEMYYAAFAKHYKPFFGELAAINWVALLPEFINNEAQCDATAGDFIPAWLMGKAQFCTNPGILFFVRGKGFDRFKGLVRDHINDDGKVQPMVMLDAGTASGFWEGCGRLETVHGMTRFGGQDKSKCSADRWETLPQGYTISGYQFLQNASTVAEEVFGPCVVLVECQDMGQLIECVSAFRFRGQLTSTLHGTPSELASPEGRKLQHLMALTSGRGIMAYPGSTEGFKWPPGVAVDANTHGGPFPSTTCQQSSVGLFAPRRFVRPFTYQGWLDSELPVELQAANPGGFMRWQNDEWTNAPLES